MHVLLSSGHDQHRNLSHCGARFKYMYDTECSLKSFTSKWGLWKTLRVFTETHNCNFFTITLSMFYSVHSLSRTLTC
jgi:hypothetical protein